MKFINKTPLLLLLIFLTIPFLLSYSARKEGEGVEEEKTFIVPPEIKKDVVLLSNLEDSIIGEIINFMNSKTGLSCQLINLEGSKIQKETYDLFLGSGIPYDTENILNYHSRAWVSINPIYINNGIYVWSTWNGSFILNNLFAENTSDNANLLKNYQGKITTINPLRDPLVLIFFYTLYKHYGEGIIIDINNSIPIYLNSREELIFALESGQYPGALGIEGYFKKSVEKGYPLSVIYGGFAGDRYKKTSVSGKNIAFIPKNSSNVEGAGHIVDFMASSIFQKFLDLTPFNPIYNDTNETLTGQTGDFLIPDLDEEGLEEFKRIFEGIAFPEELKKALSKD